MVEFYSALWTDFTPPLTPMEVLERRDRKGLYAKANAGEMDNVVGKDIPFPRPANPDLVIDNSEDLIDPSALAMRVAAALPASSFAAGTGSGDNFSEIYPYATGDRLENRNTYFYTPFHGQNLLSAWRASRDQVVKGIEASQPDSSPRPRTGATRLSGENTTALLEEALRLAETATGSAIDDLLMKFLRSFELSKRVFDAYDPDHRPIDKCAYHRIENYLTLAEVFETVYRRTAKLQFLNALLKIMDTVTAMYQTVPVTIRARLGKLIERERFHVEELAHRSGVPG